MKTCFGSRKILGCKSCTYKKGTAVWLKIVKYQRAPVENLCQHISGNEHNFTLNIWDTLETL